MAKKKYFLTLIIFILFLIGLFFGLKTTKVKFFPKTKLEEKNSIQLEKPPFLKGRNKIFKILW